MKPNRILSIVMALAMGMIAGLHASVTEHQPPAPLPEFKTPEQLAKWRSETTARTSAQEASRTTPPDSSTPFYTGKPYLAESGSYAFKYREYNPEMGRWTTVDPSGFPDGANNYLYVKNRNLLLIDNNGLTSMPGIPNLDSAIFNSIKLVSYSLSGNIKSDSQTYLEFWTATWTASISMVFDSPFNDGTTKKSTSDITKKVEGNLTTPFPAISINPLDSIDVPIVKNIPEGISSLIDAAINKIIDNSNHVQGAYVINVDSVVLKDAADDINKSIPGIKDFAGRFPKDKYPYFTE